MSGIKTIHNLGGAVATGVATKADIEAARHRKLLSDTILSAPALTVDFPTIFSDNPEYEYFEMDFEGNHNSGSTVNAYIRYYDNGVLYTGAHYHYNSTKLQASTPSGGSGTTSVYVPLVDGSWDNNYFMAMKFRFHPNNDPSTGSTGASSGAMHPGSCVWTSFGPMTWYSGRTSFGFQKGGTFPANVTGFSFWPSSGSISAKSIIRVYGLNSAGTALV